MRWKESKNDMLDVGWDKIKNELDTVFTIENVNLMGFYHVEFIVEGVKLSFYASPRRRVKSMKTNVFLNNIRVADIKSIGE